MASRHPTDLLCVCAQLLGCFQLSVTLWTIAHQAPLSMGFPGRNNGVGFHFLLQGIFPNPGFKPASLMSLSLAGGCFTTKIYFVRNTDS